MSYKKLSFNSILFFFDFRFCRYKTEMAAYAKKTGKGKVEEVEEEEEDDGDDDDEEN